MSAVLIVCPECRLVLRVMGEDAEVELLVGPRSEAWPDRFSCAACAKPARGVIEHEAEAAALSALRVVDVSPQEAFAALQGFGLPDETMCTGARVDELLRTTPIHRVAGKDVLGANRFCLDHLELSDGTRLYLGASPEGAVVYRITRRISYAARVLGDDSREPTAPKKEGYTNV